MTEETKKNDPAETSSKESTIQEIDALTIDTTPNRLTFARMVAVPLVVMLLAQRDFHMDVFATIVFIAAAITDYYDGYLARQMKSVTIYGKLLDPLADKFLVVVVLIQLQALERIAPWLVMILICREMTISSLRALASAEGVIIAAGKGGKWKAAIQMIGLPFLMVNESLFGFFPTHQIGMILIYISLVLSLTSLSTYAFDFFKELHKKRKDRRIKKKKA